MGEDLPGDCAVHFTAPAPIMQEPELAAWQRTLSVERFAEYSRTASSLKEALGRYVWNTRLSEALYPALQNVEVALRNTLHSAISTTYGGDNPSHSIAWFDRAPSLLNEDDRGPVKRAKENLTAWGKPHEVGRVVAELNFGFWTSLLDVRYERNGTFWPHLLKSAFPFMPNKIRKRKIVSARFHRIRQLRNRVFHYEPIWHWKDLREQHADLLECISWLSPEASEITRRIDRFEQVITETSAARS